jgi:hypothetical protein
MRNTAIGSRVPTFTGLALPNVAIAAGAVTALVAAVPGARVGDAVIANPRNPLQVAGPVALALTINVRVSAANQVTVDVGNQSAAPLTPLANTFDIMVLPRE